MASLYGLTKNEKAKFYFNDESTPLIRRKNEYYRSTYLSSNPLFSTNLIPYQLSSEIIHLRAAREAAKRAYSIDDIDSKNENDVSDDSDLRTPLSKKLTVYPAGTLFPFGWIKVPLESLIILVS